MWHRSAILLVIVVAGPWVFEQITFYYYLHDPSTFFAFSGTRMPLFIIVEFALGASIGFRVLPEHFRRYTLAGVLGIILFTTSVYQLCDARACYYSGPDRLGEMRFLAVLATGFVTGSVIGNLRRRAARHEFQGDSSLYPFYFAVPIFAGSFASALLYNVPSDAEFSILLFAGFMVTVFLATGAALSLLVKTTRARSALLCVLSMLVLFFLFRNWSDVTEANNVFSTAIQLTATTAGAALAAIMGYSLGARLSTGFSFAKAGSSAKERSILAFSLAIIAAFAIFNSHPGVYAPVDMLPRQAQSSYAHVNWLSGAPDPMYYSGAYSTDKYFPTKRVEVRLDLSGPLKGRGMTIAGMGAQSPNCCHDGLDYGYRTDIAKTANGSYFLVARAWETCDQNAGCSGSPWQSTMHETDMRVAIDFPARLSLAMAWPDNGAKTAHWYYRINDSNWTEFSTFAAPRIENPYFNLGVAPVGDYAHNFPSGNANFFQVGVAMQHKGSLSADTVTFECPSYYKNGLKHCFQKMEPIRAGDSHWKVLWQWGLQGDLEIHVDNPKHIIAFK